MTKCHCKNKMNNRKGNIPPPEPRYPIAASPKHSSKTEEQENDL